VSDYTPDHRALLWPPAFEQRANAEGWTLRVGGGFIEVDLFPSKSSDEPTYHDLMMWIVLNAYVCGSAMHRTAWEFEYDANAEVYADGRVPGDGMYRVYNDDTGEVSWVTDDGGREWQR
jgi:hypothetical protein